MAELDIVINPSGAQRGGDIVKRMLNDIKAAATGSNVNLLSFAQNLARIPTPATAAAAAAAMVAAAMVAVAKSTATHTHEMQKFALSTNVSTAEAQLFASMARQTGLDVNGLSGGLSKLNQNIQEAAKGSGDSQRLFGALGVSFKDTSGKARETGSVFQDVVGKLGDFRNDSEKTTLISKLMGDEMQQMARIGRSGFQNLSNEAKVMNSILDEDSVKAAEKFNQQIARTGTILEGWKLKIGENVLPYLNDMLAAMNKFATGRDLPALPGMEGQQGNKSLALPPDPNQQRQLLEQQLKERQLVLERNAEVEKEENAGRALDFRKMFENREMTAKAYFASQAEHRLADLASEKSHQEQLLLLEVDRFLELRKLGGRSPEQRMTEEAEARARVMEIQNKLGKNDSQTILARKEVSIGYTSVAGKTQEEVGQQIVDGLISQFKIGEDLRHKDQDNALTYFQNLEKFQDAYGATREQQLTTQYDLVRAGLAKELDVTNDTAAKVLNAWRNGDSIHAAELIGSTTKTWDEVTAIMFRAMGRQREISKQASDDMFGGFAESMHRYVNDQSMFGLGVDQARSVAQAMQQSFKVFFFDAMEGHVKGFEDVLKGLTDFAKNMVSDVASKLVSRSLLQGLDSLPGLFAGGGGIPSGGYNAASLLGMKGYAEGGIVTRPSIAGESGPEAVVPLPNGRSIPVQWTGAPYGMPDRMMSTSVSVPIAVNIVNHKSDADVQVRQGTGANGMQELHIMVVQAVSDGFNKGKFDGPMRSRFNMAPQPVRR